MSLRTWETLGTMILGRDGDWEAGGSLGLGIQTGVWDGAKTQDWCDVVGVTFMSVGIHGCVGWAKSMW